MMGTAMPDAVKPDYSIPYPSPGEVSYFVDVWNMTTMGSLLSEYARTHCEYGYEDDDLEQRLYVDKQLQDQAVLRCYTHFGLFFSGITDVAGGHFKEEGHYAMDLLPVAQDLYSAATGAYQIYGPEEYADFKRYAAFLRYRIAAWKKSVYPFDDAVKACVVAALNRWDETEKRMTEIRIEEEPKRKRKKLYNALYSWVGQGHAGRKKQESLNLRLSMPHTGAVTLYIKGNFLEFRVDGLDEPLLESVVDEALCIIEKLEAAQ